MDYFPPKKLKGVWCEPRSSTFRLGHLKTSSGEFWWLGSYITNKGYYASCWQTKIGGTVNVKKSKYYSTEKQAIDWIENYVIKNAYEKEN